MEEKKIEEENEGKIAGNVEETLEKVEEEADEREMLVLRRVLSGQKGANHMWQFKSCPHFAWGMWCPNVACNLPETTWLDLIGAFGG